MKASLFCAIVSLASFSSAVVEARASIRSSRWRLLATSLGARTALARAAQANPNSVRPGPPTPNFWIATATRARATPTANSSPRSAMAAIPPAPPPWRAAWRCSIFWPATAAAANTHLEASRAAGGKSVSLGAPPAAKAPGNAGTATIPGPLRSFARMAALSPDSDPADVLPALARNVVTNGYQASHSNEALEQTEYLKLVHRYLSQARELEKLAGEISTHQDRELRIARGRRAAAHPRLPHARRLRQRSGAGNRQRRRARFSPPIPASRSTIWSRRCAPTAPSPTISTPPRCR